MTAAAVVAVADGARKRALDEVRARARPELVGELVYDAITRQAESRGAALSSDEVNGRAAELGLSAELASKELGGLIELLVRGPTDTSVDDDLARIAAFFARGLGAKLERIPEPGRPENCRRLAQLHDRLCLTGYGGFLAYVDDLLPANDASGVWEALSTVIAEEARAGELRHAAFVLRVDGLRHAPPARREVLLSSLHNESSAAGSVLRGALGATNGSPGRDPTLVYGTARATEPEASMAATPSASATTAARTPAPQGATSKSVAAVPTLEALAASAFATQASRATGSFAVPAGDIVVEGRCSTPRRATFWRALGLLTGMTLLWRLGALVGRLVLGFRSRGSLQLSTTELRYRVQTEFFGRVWAQRDQRLRLPTLSSAAREEAQSSSSLIVGVVAIALGATFGTLVFGDGLAGSSGGLALLGLAIVLLGVGIEVGAYYVGLLRKHGPSCAIEIEALPKVRIRLTEVAPEKAIVLLEALSQRCAK